MRFDVLGPLRVSCGDTVLHLGEPQQQKLLALLLACANDPVSTERLIDEIWGAEPPPSARHLVHVYIARLRAEFKTVDDRERIVRDTSSYQIDVVPDEVDGLGLTAAIDQARELRHMNPVGAARHLRAATDRWRGTPFGDLSDNSPLLRSEGRRLEGRYVTAVTELIDLEIEVGLHPELVVDLEHLTARFPFHERFSEQLMLVLYRSGRQADALRVYQELRTVLGDELGIEPGPAAKDLERRILIHDPGLLWEPPPPPSNLPARLSSFVGRRHEIAEVAKLLETTRLITLTGTGGSGKTRLAEEVAEHIALRFPDGVWWVDLAPATDSDEVVAALAANFGVAPQPAESLLESVIRSLARRNALLLLDNCEHIAGPVADVAGELLRHAHRLRVLATSRAPLHVSGEMLWTVPPLALPPAGESSMTAIELSDAVRLFVDRAVAVESAFSLDTENARAVLDICHRLDGLPLAIEMAAARLNVLSPAQIATSLSDRFRLLTLPRRDTSPRHETLEAAIDWSFELIDPDVQRIFSQLCVFAGAFDLAAAEAVAGGASGRVLDAVSTLVESSMLTTAGTESSTVRYRMLETLREYGLRRFETSNEEAAARESHAEYFLGLAERAHGTINTPDFADWVSRLQSVEQDLHQALDWSLGHHPRATTLRAAWTLFHLWFRTGAGPEAGSWGRRMLDDADDAPASLRAAAHLAVSFSGNMLGDPEIAGTNVRTAIRLCRESGDPTGLVTALFGGASVALLVGDLERAAALSREAVEICDVTGARWSRAGPLANLGFVHLASGSADEARGYAELALSLYRELGDIAGQVVMSPLTAIAMRQGDLEAAQRFAGDAAEVAAGSSWEGAALVGLADVLIAREDDAGAESTAQSGLVRALDSGVEIWFRRALRALAHINARRGDALRGAQLLGASRRNAHLYEPDPAFDELTERLCRAHLDADSFVLAAEQGHQMNHEQLLALAGVAP